MRYQYILAFQLKGITKPTSDIEEQIIDLPALCLRGRLTSNLDRLPTNVDLATAISDMLLRGFVGQTQSDSREEYLEQKASEIRHKRLEETVDGTFLIIEAYGEEDNFDPQPQCELTNCIFAIDDSPKHKIRLRHEAAIYGLLASLMVASDHLCLVNKFAECITFLGENDKPLFCFTLSGSGFAYGSSALPLESLPSIKKNAKTLSRHQSLIDVARLLSRSMLENSDPLLSFLSVWSGLEIFINKNFKQYEELILARLTIGNPPFVPVQLIERISKVMSDKYRLSDKFSVIATELADPDLEQDQNTFDSIKVTRDKLLHGEDIPLTSLPIVDANKLLRKYLRLHLARDGA